MAKRKRRRSGARSHRRRRSFRRRSNPMFAMAAPRRRHHHRRHRSAVRRRRRNPSLRGLASGSTVSLVGGGAIGFFGSRFIPQNVPFLSQYNTGLTGYALNAGTGLALSWLLKKFWNGQAATGALVGTGIAVISRVIVERFNAASGGGMSGDLDFDLGYYTSDRFPFPQGAGGPFDTYPGSPYLPASAITSASAVRAGQAAAGAALPAAAAAAGTAAVDPTKAQGLTRWGQGRWS